MAMGSGDDYDRDILDIIPERFDADADSRQARAGHRLRTYLTLGVAVVAVGAIVATGLHFMGPKRVGGPGIPVIKADERPLKTRPDDRGGMQVPNQDKLVYERMEAGEGDAKVERLLPAPEQPVTPPKVAATPDLTRRPATEIIRTAEPAAKVAPAPAPVAPQPVAAAPMPQPVASAPVAQPVPPQPAAKAPAYQPSQTRAPAPAAAPVAVPPPQVVAAAPAPAPAPATAVKPTVGGDWLIQLGALKGADLAEKEWARIQRANADLLGGLKSDVMRVELGEKGTFWRLRAGPLSEQAAKTLCSQLKERNLGCILARK